MFDPKAKLDPTKVSEAEECSSKMKITLQNDLVEPFLKRLFYEAWKACGGTIGRGFIQDNPKAEIDEVYDCVVNSKDYVCSQNTPTSISADYVFGRMMKFGVHLIPGEKEASIEIGGSMAPRSDYQAWSRKYKTYEELVEAALDLA